MRAYWLQKIFSLVGLLVGVYVCVHLYNNLWSLYGEDQFNEHLRVSRHAPLLASITVLVLWIPIMFHGLYGLFAMKKTKLVRYAYFGNLKYVIQRLSGLGLLVFIPAHVFKTRIAPGFLNTTLDYAHMHEALHEPLTLVVYCLGVLGVAYHLANGLWQFAIGWGVVRTAKAMRVGEALCIGFFVLIALMGYASICGFYLNSL